MPIKPDERAMLQLLLERGQSYEDIASLLGTDVAGVRARARAALTELGGADPDRDVSLTDFLLGQADPIGRADAVRHMQEDAGSRRLAEDLIAQLQVIAPKARLPELPAQRGRKGRSEVTAAPPPSKAGGKASGRPPSQGRFWGALTRTQRRIVLGLGAAALAAIAVVIAVSGDGGASKAAPTTTTSSACNESVTKVALLPSSGTKARGLAVFGRTGDQAVLRVDAAGLPAQSARPYVLWLLTSASEGVPLGRVPPDKAGRISVQIPVPATLQTAILPNVKFVDLSQSSVSDVERNLKTAQAKLQQVQQNAQNGKPQQISFPHYTGQSVLRGVVPC